ncbi:MAG TPA: hypothetical protein VFM18_18320 [Methanosarcina sp.]|nr:hypothetical protein [Methanosarcina sp.]
MISLELRYGRPSSWPVPANNFIKALQEELSGYGDDMALGIVNSHLLKYKAHSRLVFEAGNPRSFVIDFNNEELYTIFTL